MQNRILLLSDHPDDATLLAEAAGVSGSAFEVARTVKEVVEQVSKQAVSAVFIDVTKIERLRELESSFQETIGLFSDQIKPNLIYMLSERELSQTRDVVLSPLFSTFYQRPVHEIGLNGRFFGRFLKVAHKGIRQDLTDYLGELAEVQKIELNHTSQKQEAVEAVRQYLIAAKIPARISNMIGNAVDELLMNAMFDAPSDDFGKQLYSSTARTQERELIDREKVQMSIGFDGFYVGVSVADQFGSIDRQRLLNLVSANYKESDYTVKTAQAGAGLGLATVYNCGATLIYNCELRQRTESTLLYRAYPTYREFKSQPKFFSARFHV